MAGTSPAMTAERAAETSNRAGGNVHRQRQQCRIEEERHDTVCVDGVADRAPGDGNVGDLRGHADDEGEVDEIPVVRRLLAGKVEATRLVVARAIEIMRVM